MSKVLKRMEEERKRTRQLNKEMSEHAAYVSNFDYRHIKSEDIPILLTLYEGLIKEYRKLVGFLKSVEKTSLQSNVVV